VLLPFDIAPARRVVLIVGLHQVNSLSPPPFSIGPLFALPKTFFPIRNFSRISFLVMNQVNPLFFAVPFLPLADIRLGFWSSRHGLLEQSFFWTEVTPLFPSGFLSLFFCPRDFFFFSVSPRSCHPDFSRANEPCSSPRCILFLFPGLSVHKFFSFFSLFFCTRD